MSEEMMNDELRKLFAELEIVFFGTDPRYNGENPACEPIEVKIEAELMKLSDEEIVELVDSVEPGSRLEDMLFSPIIGVVDEGRTNLDPQVNPNNGTVYWHGWPDGISIKWQRQKKSGDHL
jgi:hypothetical protein